MKIVPRASQDDFCTAIWGVMPVHVTPSRGSEMMATMEMERGHVRAGVINKIGNHRENGKSSLVGRIRT